jgi:hypothetical protein
VTWALLLSDDDDQEIVARFDAVLGLECSGAIVAVRGRLVGLIDHKPLPALKRATLISRSSPP